MNIKNKFLIVFFALVLSCYPSFAGICWAAEGYLMTEQEMQMLNSNLTKLEQISVQQEMELQKQKSTLIMLNQELEASQNQLNTSKISLQEAEKSLQIANSSLKKLEAEEKSKRMKIKAQRNFAWTVAGILLTSLIVKS